PDHVGSGVYRGEIGGPLPGLDVLAGERVLVTGRRTGSTERRSAFLSPSRFLPPRASRVCVGVSHVAYSTSHFAMAKRTGDRAFPLFVRDCIRSVRRDA